MEDAQENGFNEESPVGGASLEEANKHLARRFQSSASRAQMSLLGPDTTLDLLSNSCVQAFSQGRVSILDIPAGSGVGPLTLLCSIASLRKQGVLPPLPLEVWISAGELSVHCHEVANEMYSLLATYFNSQNMNVRFRAIQWDVTDPMSNTRLMQFWNSCPGDFSNYLIFVSNFSGFLSSSQNWKKSKQQLHEIFRWCRLRDGQTVWIEPGTSKAGQLLWSKLRGLVEEFFSSIGKDRGVRTSSPVAVLENQSNPDGSNGRPEVAIAVFEGQVRHVIFRERKFPVRLLHHIVDPADEAMLGGNDE